MFHIGVAAPEADHFHVSTTLGCSVWQWVEQVMSSRRIELNASEVASGSVEASASPFMASPATSPGLVRNQLKRMVVLKVS